MAINRKKRIASRRTLLFKRLEETKRIVKNSLNTNRIAIANDCDFLTLKEINNLEIIETLTNDMIKDKQREKIKIYNHLEI